MVAATIGSAILGLWDKAAFLVLLYGAAEGVEELTLARTRSSIRSLLALAPTVARLKRNGEEIEIPAEDLNLKDVFIVRPGVIPNDGVIIRGRTSVNEAAVTGEPLPVEKNEGSSVYAATLNQDGLIEVSATALFQDNTLSKIIHLVEEAQEQKSRTQLFIERFGRVYSPIVLLSAFIILLIRPIIGLSDGDLSMRAVVLLVAAAPCALIMSTPVAVAAGIGVAGKIGILVKGGIHLENLGKIRAVAFDKTGTLTCGEPVVTDIFPVNATEQKVMELAYSVEVCSEHPLSLAVIPKAEQMGLKSVEVEKRCALPGHGVMAKVGGDCLYM